MSGEATGADRAPHAAGNAGTRGAGACDACLRRGALLGRLTPRIAGLLGRRRGAPAGLMVLSDERLVAALAAHDAEALRRWLARFSPDAARAALRAGAIDAICRHSQGYPPQLLDLPDPPALLYVASGAGERLDTLAAEPAVTIVGGREATPYGLEVARTLGRGLAAAGVTVVSGLALGVDAAAHRGALAAGDRAIAVLGGGVDVPYPAANGDLYEDVRRRGAVISELPPGTAPARWCFPARNRIMAALGQLTVVAEAREGSGSLITAGFAEQLGRVVGAVPGRVTNSKAAGSNRLLADGARVIRDAADVLDELFGVGLGRDGAPRAGAAAEAAARRRALVAGLDVRLRRVLDGVEANLGVEAIGHEAGLGPGEVRGALGRLERMGLVERDGLGAYERTADG